MHSLRSVAFTNCFNSKNKHKGKNCRDCLYNRFHLRYFTHRNLLTLNITQPSICRGRRLKRVLSLQDGAVRNPPLWSLVTILLGYRGMIQEASQWAERSVSLALALWQSGYDKNSPPSSLQPSWTQNFDLLFITDEDAQTLLFMWIISVKFSLMWVVSIGKFHVKNV